MPFGVTPISPTIPSDPPEFSEFIQFESEGEPLGGPTVQIVNFLSPLKATRGAGENAHIITVRQAPGVFVSLTGVGAETDTGLLTPGHLCTNGPVWQVASIDNTYRWGAGFAKIAPNTWVGAAVGVSTVPSVISIDDGATWSISGTIPNPSGNNASLMKYGNGRLLCTQGIPAVYSDDGSVTWSRVSSLGFSPVGLEFAQGLFSCGARRPRR